ncbi:MAG: 3-oxoadipate enol-lactonase [Thermodesulfobacteriota bacterium]
MMYIQANGIRIHYELEGSSSAPVMTLSNSLATNLSMWEPQMEILLRSYRVLRYDTRGHGKSEVSEGPYSFEMLAADVRSLLRALGIEKTYFMGISMGGMIGQQLALESPEMLTSMILCDTSSHVPQEAWPIWDERIRIAETQGLEPLLQQTLERWFTLPFRNQHPEVIKKIGDMIRATDRRGYIGCCHAIRNLNLRDRLREIRVPTLILVGEEDLGTPVSAAQTIQEGIAGSKLVVLKSAAHLSNIEQSKRFNDAVASFLGKNAKT